MRLKDIIILQNKVDLVTEAAAQNQAEAIHKFIQGTIAGAPLVWKGGGGGDGRGLAWAAPVWAPRGLYQPYS